MSNIKLSPRMQAIADMAEGKTACDIGCDHALISIYLVKERNFDRVIAMDLRKGPLEIAKKNVSLYGVCDKIDIRLSDGFDGLMTKEAQTAIIAGMGGGLMVDILKRGKLHTDNKITLILQPQSEPERIRRYLIDLKYVITDETMVLDEGKYYVVIKALPGEDEPYSEEELLYGRILIQKKDRLLKTFLDDKYKKKQKAYL